MKRNAFFVDTCRPGSDEARAVDARSTVRTVRGVIQRHLGCAFNGFEFFAGKARIGKATALTLSQFETGLRALEELQPGLEVSADEAREMFAKAGGRRDALRRDQGFVPYFTTEGGQPMESHLPTAIRFVAVHGKLIVNELRGAQGGDMAKVTYAQFKHQLKNKGFGPGTTLDISGKEWVEFAEIANPSRHVMGKEWVVRFVNRCKMRLRNLHSRNIRVGR